MTKIEEGLKIDQGACQHGYFRDVETCAICEAEEERDEARALTDLAIETLIAMQLTGVAADLAARRTWQPAADATRVPAER